MPSPQERESALFALAVEKPAADRTAFLQAVCGSDSGLRQRLEALLAAHDHPEELLGCGAAATMKATIKLDLPDAPDEAVGQTLGRYKLLEQIGEGGCGIVYVAEQKEPVRRKVALKVIKLGMDTKQVVARFEAERQALAMMDHPNIAKVLDAGTTDVGRPYFVMELVRGIKITDYCDQANLSTKERLDLFIKVCHAIQHAHQKGIIHRDIKPSNILVTLHDGVPVPKVIDFGIAKATQGELTEKTIHTQFQQFIGTPAYMSPEQAEMSGLDIDTRSDIYSLGVLLYELLAGSTPFDAKELMSQGIDAMRKTIREKEPVRPSTKLSQTLVGADVRRLKSPAFDKPSSEEEIRASSRRLLRIKETITLLRGDLDWIVMKCLEKDRQRRYDTANGLAADLKRHLNNEPVVACPPSTAYRFKKALKRHRFAFSSAAAIAVVLVAGIAVSTWQSIRANHLGQIAAARLVESEKSRDENRAILSFLTEVFQSEDAEITEGRAGSMTETLDAAVRRLDFEFADRPARRAEIQITLAASYVGLKQPKAALPLYEQARDYFLTRNGADHESTIKAMHGLANCYHLLGRKEEARALRQSLLDRSRRVNGLEHPMTIAAMHGVALDLTHVQALPVREEVLRLSRKVNGLNHSTTYKAMWNLQLSYAAVGEVPESYPLQAELTSLGLQRYGAEPTQVRKQFQRAEFAFYDVGRWQEALRLRTEFTQKSASEISVELPALLAWFGQTNELEACDRLMADRARRIQSPEVVERAAKASCLIPGRSPELLEQALSLSRYAVEKSPDHPLRHWFLISLGMAEYRSGHFAAAEKALASGDELCPKNGGDQPRSLARLYRAMSLWEMGDKEKSRRTFDSAIPRLTPWPEDEQAPTAKGNADDVVNWLALREARTMLGVPAPDASPVQTWLGNLERTVAERPDDRGQSLHLGLTYLWLHKDVEHQDLCRRLLRSVSESRNPASHEKAAKVLLLHPNPDPELLNLAAESARKSLALAKPNDESLPWSRIAAALVASRTGRAADAEALLTQVASSTRNGAQRGLALAVRARVRRDLGRAAEARADLAEVDKLAIPEPDRRQVTWVLRKAEYLAIHLATREARALLSPQ